MSEAKVTCVLKNVCPGTGEGPHWDESTQTLYFVNIRADVGEVFRWNYGSNVAEEITLGSSFTTFILPRKEGGFVASLGQSVIQFDWNNPDDYSVIASVEEGRDTRFNDAKCDSSGRIWAGTMALETSPAVLEKEQGSLYCIDKDKKVTQITDKVTISNGLAWSLDEKILYFVESIPSRVYAFDYDKETGVASNKHCIIEFANVGSEDSIGIADGMCIDNEGMLWIACYSGGQVVRFDPKSGKLLRTVKIPAKRTTSCCFGGPNYDELFVTSSRLGYTEEEFNKSDPLAGSLFKITGLGVHGFKPNVYEG
ncbi:regucalcin-like [Tubulanus polymorphus]|uniref:regucalcin-like n=1 Tax=Tubulanus polymorphus TaxID=672921 RepID=UPI003DA5A1CB